VVDSSLLWEIEVNVIRASAELQKSIKRPSTEASTVWHFTVSFDHLEIDPGVWLYFQDSCSHVPGTLSSIWTYHGNLEQ
jgi:hypothetical protein